MKITKFRLFNLFALLLVLGTKCSSEYYEPIDVTQLALGNMVIEQTEGLKFEQGSIIDGSKFNFKTSNAGKYTLHLTDMRGSLVAKERFDAEIGDNVLTFYTKSLKVGDYTLKFYNEKGQLLQTDKLYIQ